MLAGMTYRSTGPAGLLGLLAYIPYWNVSPAGQ
jgi:hypothetical protein